MIPAGQNAATFSIAIKGDTQYELNELLRLQLVSASNSQDSTAIASSSQGGRATITITNDEPAPTVIHAGETLTVPLALAGGQFTVEAGGKLEQSGSQAAITWSGADDLTIDNAGVINGGTNSHRAVTIVADTTKSLTINNLAGGLISGELFAEGPRQVR